MYDLTGFDETWAAANEKEQVSLISKAVKLSPSQGIICILAGITSYSFSVRIRARQGLDIFTKTLSCLIKEHSCHEELLYALKESALFSAKIYNVLLKSKLSRQEISLYLRTLLESKGRGPFYAWKFWRNSNISRKILEKIVLSIPEKERLLLVDQYLKSSPVIRRKFADEFKKILQSINTQKNVIKFYAFLFDKNRDADPFLHYIDPKLIDPQTIISEYINSNDPEEKSCGIKALSMVTKKIKTSILLDMISDKEHSMVKQAVLNVIEKSPIETYPELFDNIYKLICKSEKTEAMAGFRALVVSKPFSLSKLTARIKKNAPELMNDIINEISSLSRLSFFFIQELAITNPPYPSEIRDVYRGLVNGILLKRPERILKILKKYEDCHNTATKITALNFAQKINEFILLEKKEINKQFASSMAKGEYIYAQNKKARKGIIKGFFSDSVLKKLKSLNQEFVPDTIDFQEENIENADLSHKEFSNFIIFNDSTIKNSNLSFSTFLNADFRGAFFYNVNFKGVKFKSTSFDNSIFINVRADDAEFINCSFNDAYFFNTNFESACMSESIFTGAFIAKVNFMGTDLSDASFVCARIFSVYFTDSNLFQTDFTGIKARFCRFPSHSALNIEKEYADLNAINIQFKKKNIPDSLFNPSKSASMGMLSSEINMLLFSEFTHFGKKMFLKQNKYSLLTSLDIFKPEQGDLFEIIPLLIHENINFPEYDANKKNSPHGISNYCPSSETLLIAEKYLPNKEFPLRVNKKSYVEGLFTMGSIGSIAQTSDSDIDYWVCVKNYDFDKEMELKFKQKLEKLEEWAWNTFKTEIHFFIVDIKKAARNDFGTSTTESSGSAQAKILKEEFYRTMIYVAGKLPLWCTLPVAVSKKYYTKLCLIMYISSASCQYMDLGDIHDIPSGEYFGASIWQMFKWLKSPFKSVIKFSLLEQFLRESDRKPLLCNKFKDRWMNAGLQFELAKIDSYYTLLTSLIQYYKDNNNPKALRFVQLCFFLKIDISSNTDLSRGIFGFRQIFIMHCMHKWQWKKEDVFKFGGFRQWPYKGILELSYKVKQYMIDTYGRMKEDFKNTGILINADTKKKSPVRHENNINHDNRISRQFPDQSLITPRDITVLGRKIFVQFAQRLNKIEKIFLISKNSYHFHGLDLRFSANSSENPFWRLIHKSGKTSMGKEEILKKAYTIEEIAAWFIHNGFYSNQIFINLLPNPTPVTCDDIIKLFNAIDNFFPYDTHDIKSDVLLAEESINFLFISMNLCVSRKIKKVLECSVIYMNSWGEMFFRFFSKKEGFDSLEQVKKTIKKNLKIKKLPEKTMYYTPRSFRHTV